MYSKNVAEELEQLFFLNLFSFFVTLECQTVRSSGCSLGVCLAGDGGAAGLRQESAKPTVLTHRAGRGSWSV